VTGTGGYVSVVVNVVVYLDVRHRNAAALVSGREAMFTFRTLVLKTELSQSAIFDLKSAPLVRAGCELKVSAGQPTAQYRCSRDPRPCLWRLACLRRAH
jgi:hypothetical protein